MEQNSYAPFRVILCFLAAGILSGWCVFQLKADQSPQEDLPVLLVSFSQPDTSPDIIEQQVTAVIEGASAQLGQLKNIYSISGYNKGTVRLEFDKGTDMAMKQFELASLIRQIYPSLPSTVSYPSVSSSLDRMADERNLLQSYAIYATLQPYQIRKEVETVFRKVFTGMPGIQDVVISGVEHMQLTIRFDKAMCEVQNIAPKEIIHTVQSYFTTAYTGSYTAGSGETYFLQMHVPGASVEMVENILIGGVRIKDIAEVFLEHPAANGYFRINGKNAVTLQIYAQPGENRILLGKQVQQQVQSAMLQLPPHYGLSLRYDAMAFLQGDLQRNYQRAGLSLAILLVFLLMAYRNWIYLLNLVASLLMCICITIVFAWLFNRSIHLYSLAGLAISFGMMVDNAIVMLDHFQRFRNRKIFTAILGSALTAIAALSLVFFLPDKEQAYLADLSVIIILALLASLVTVLWFTPALYKLTLSHSRIRHMRIGGLRRYYATISFIANYRRTFLLLLLLLFGLPFFLLPARWEGEKWYHAWYNVTLGSESYQEHYREYVNQFLGGSLRLFADNIRERAAYRNREGTKLIVQAALPYGNTMEQMNYILAAFEKYLSATEGIDEYVTTISSGQNGSMEISFKKEYDLTSFPQLLKARLVENSLSRGGVEWNIYGIGQGFSNSGVDEVPRYGIMMKGYNYDELGRQVLLGAEKLRRHSRVRKVNMNEHLGSDEKESTEYVLHLDRMKMSLFNTNQFEVLNRLTDLAKPTGTAGQLPANGDAYSLVLKERTADAYSRYDLLNTPIQLDSNRRIRLSEIGDISLQGTSSSIHKVNRQYMKLISYEYLGSTQAGRTYQGNVLKEMNAALPAGYTASQQTAGPEGTGGQQRYLLIGVLMLSLFFICGIIFENLQQAIFIICIIPVSFIGLFLIFSWWDVPFDQGGYAAFIMLGALVTNAGIYVVNDLNKAKLQHATIDHNKVLIYTVANRARTVLLTTISTCCGLIPFMITAEREVFWFSLAVGTTGGLLFSLFAVFIVLPVLLWRAGGVKFI